MTPHVIDCRTLEGHVAAMRSALTRRSALAAALLAPSAAVACAHTPPPPPALEPGMHRFASFDGREIAYRILGVSGRPTLLIHGFTADAQGNWIDPGVAAALVGSGAQAILPDLRGHGASVRSDDPDAYPEDALARDQEALLAHLGVTRYDLVGYSLGARTAVRMLARGAKPRRVVLGGMGDSGILNVAGRRAYFDALLTRDPTADPRALAYIDRIVAERRLSRAELLLVLRQQISTSPETLSRLSPQTLVIAGKDDDDNGSAEGLAWLFPNARAVRTSGNHLTAFNDPTFAQAIVNFLAETPTG